MRITAIITAGGVGTRMGHETPKQFIQVGGKSILEHTIDVFKANKLISDIVVTLPKDAMDQYADTQVSFVEGGKSRQASIYNGLKSLSVAPDLVIIHDGVRCLLEQKDLNDVINGCQKPFDGAVLAHPVRDTLKKVQDTTIEKTIDRKNLWAMQTPQVFFFDKLIQAYEKAMEDGLNATDDAQVIEHAGGKVAIIKGAVSNIKMTYPEDLDFIKKWMRV